MKLYTEAELDKMLKALYDSEQLSRCNLLPYIPKPIDVMLIGVATIEDQQELNSMAAKLADFNLWLKELKGIAETLMPKDYKPGDKWLESFWKDKYYDKGFSPTAAWTDYTKHVK